MNQGSVVKLRWPTLVMFLHMVNFRLRPVHFGVTSLTSLSVPKIYDRSFDCPEDTGRVFHLEGLKSFAHSLRIESVSQSDG